MRDEHSPTNVRVDEPLAPAGRVLAGPRLGLPEPCLQEPEVAGADHERARRHDSDHAGGECEPRDRHAAAPPGDHDQRGDSEVEAEQARQRGAEDAAGPPGGDRERRPRATLVVEDEHEPVEQREGRESGKVVLAEERRLPAARGDEADRADRIGDEREGEQQVDERLELAAVAEEQRGAEAERGQFRHLHPCDECRRAVGGGARHEDQAERSGGADRQPKLARETTRGDAREAGERQRGEQHVGRHDRRRRAADTDVE